MITMMEMDGNAAVCRVQDGMEGREKKDRRRVETSKERGVIMVIATMVEE